MEYDRADAERQVILEILQSVMLSEDLGQLLKLIHRSISKVLYAENCFVALYDPETKLITFKFYVDKYDPQPKPRPLSAKTLSAYVLRTGQPIRLSDAGDAVFQALQMSGEVALTGTDAPSWLGVPLRSQMKTIGVLVVQHYEKSGIYSDQDVEFLSSVGGQIALAIERKQTEASLKLSEERFSLVTRATNDAIWDWNLITNNLWWNTGFQKIFGYIDEEIEPGIESWTSRLHPDDMERVTQGLHQLIESGEQSWADEYRFRRGDGEYALVIDRGYVVHAEGGKPIRMLGSMMDITERKRTEDKLLHDAFHDALTGLANRALLMDRLKLAIERVKRRKDKLFAVLFLDLDRFKNINDSLGHILGDELLLGIANRLTLCVRNIDTVARLGGDEFAILLDDIAEANDAIWIAERVQNSLAEPFNLGGHEVVSTVSIGIALSLSGYDHPEDLLRDADTAMYRAKTGGKARHEVFDKLMHANAVRILKLETELRKAIERNEFCIYYQPIISLADDKICGFEALVRWRHSDGRLILPMDFIPVAEETGLIIPIGIWVLREACRQMREWESSIGYKEPLRLSVNLSGKQFCQSNLVDQIRNILHETGFNPELLHLEITESVVIQNTEAVTQMLNEIKAMGVRLSMDDFGTGYSSLSYLHRFPIHTLKIDKSFVSGEASAGDSEIVRTIIMLASSLGMDVIAEGVETAEQLAKLKTLNCTYGQGYLFSHPVDVISVQTLIQDQFSAGCGTSVGGQDQN